MAGICGVIGIANGKALVERMCQLISHRGPQDWGLYEDDGVVLGCRRGAIYHLPAAHELIHDERESIWAMCDGEIYERADLRPQLIAKGHRFYTQSDAELLIHLYEEEGWRFVEGLHGIFAFALWDSVNRRLLLARDHVGVKPLHYFLDGNKLIFSSEIKAILLAEGVERKVDLQSLHYTLNLRYIPGEGTLFQGIKRLPAGSVLLYENGGIRVERYWRLEVYPDRSRNEQYYIEHIQELLRNAIKRRMTGDVPIGVSLSGGMDTSSIVALSGSLTTKPVKTFSMGLNQPSDELDDARFIAEYFGTDHHEVMLDRHPLKHLPQVVWHTEEPKVNPLQSFLLAKFAGQHAKVILDGLGGDELFAGYFIHQLIYPSQFLHGLIPGFVAERLFPRLSSLIFGLQNRSKTLRWDEYRRGLQMALALGDRTRYYLILRNVWDYDRACFNNIYSREMANQSLDLTHTLFERYFRKDGLNFLGQVLRAEFETKLVDDFLLAGDRMAMAHGLGVRFPYLDRDLVEFAFTIPADINIKGNKTKYIFKKAMADVLPERTLQKKKEGFAINPYHLFREDLKSTAERILTRKRIEAQGLFNYDYIQRILKYPPHPRMRWHYCFIWMLVGFEIWHQMFIEDGNLQKPSFLIEDYYGEE